MPPRPTVLAAVSAALREHRARLLVLARTAASGGGEELVHDARVTLRRLAAVARLSRDVPVRGDGEALRVAARDLRRQLSAARTAEVCRALLVSRAAPGRTSRARARRLARELFPDADGPVSVDPHALRAVARHAADRLLEIRRAAGPPSDTPGAARPTGTEGRGRLAAFRLRLERRLERRVERRSLRAFDRLRRQLPPRPKDLHRVRIAAKHARYALELARPFLADAGPFLTHLKEFQEVAGDAHDRQELEAALEAASRERPQLSALGAEISAEAAAAAQRARLCGQTLLAHLSARPPRWRGADAAG